MEYKSPLLAAIGIIAFIIWSFEFWKIGQKALVTIPRASRSGFKISVRAILYISGLVAFGFISYSLTQPRIPHKFSPSSIEVNDIILTIDVSRSMLAEDLAPNRLEVAKEKIRQFAAMRPTDRISVIIFSEKVLTLLPLTTDPALVDQVLSEISIGYLGSGTNIGDALGLSVARAVNSETKNKVIVLLTDGVANVGNLTPLQAAEEAKKHNIKVYTIGLAADGDAKIPTGNSIFGKQYQLIPGGSIDYKVLQDIASLTGGKFYPAKSEKALQDILSDIQNLEKTEIKVQNQIVYDEKYFPALLNGVVILLIVEILRRLLLKEVV